MKPHRSFYGELAASKDPTVDAAVKSILLQAIPGAIGVQQGTTLADKMGADYWVQRQPPRFPVAVDLKARREDWLPKGKDDLALETWSVIETQSPGWTRDPRKGTDHILWYWKDTKRWVLLPFHQLCHVFIAKWEEWATAPKAQIERQESVDKETGNLWHSECVLVPRGIVWQAMCQDSFGYMRTATPKPRALSMIEPSFEELDGCDKPGSCLA